MLLNSIFAVAFVPLITGLFPLSSFLRAGGMHHAVQKPETSKLSFNPFKHFAPKVYYYQVQTTTTAAAPKTPREICTMTHNGCYINGNCYKHFGLPVLQSVAIDNCKLDIANGGCGGELWIPNLDDLDLYDKIVECNRGDFFASEDRGVWLNLKSCANTDPVADFTENHLCESFVFGDPAGYPPGDCNVLKWDFGSFYVDDDDCTAADYEYVCKCPI